MQIIITLVFSVAMLMFMIFPAMKITQWVDKDIIALHKWYDTFMIFITILLSLGIGLFLQFA